MLRRYDRGYRPYVRGYLDPEQLCGVAFGERLEPLPGPNHRTFRHLVHQPVPDPELAGERLDVGLRREKAVRSPFHDESLPPLSHHDTARAPLALEHDHLCPGPDQLPRGRQAGEASPDDDARHTHPRSPAARMRSGRLCAVNSTCTVLGEGKRCSACLTRSATASRNLGWSPQLRTSASSSRPWAAASSFCS